MRNSPSRSEEDEWLRYWAEAGRATAARSPARARVVRAVFDIMVRISLFMATGIF